jgi:hypothetical protein
MRTPFRIRDVVPALPFVLVMGASTVAADAATLTPDYLEGRWCYADIDFGGQVEDVAVEYVFNIDGTLEYQNSSMSDRMNSGTWAVADGKIEIKPSLVFFDLVIREVGDDAFVLEAMGGKHRFLRGACGG